MSRLKAPRQCALSLLFVQHRLYSFDLCMGGVSLAAPVSSLRKETYLSCQLITPKPNTFFSPMFDHLMLERFYLLSLVTTKTQTLNVLELIKFKYCTDLLQKEGKKKSGWKWLRHVSGSQKAYLTI